MSTCSDSRKQSSWQVLADTEHGGGLAPVFLMDRFQDGYEVLEGWAKGGLCLPAVLHEDIDLGEEKLGLWSLLCSQSDDRDRGKVGGGGRREVSPPGDISRAVAASPLVPAAQ